MSLAFAAPALPLHSAGKYVAGAYIVFLVVILVYVTIMAVRLTRSQRELGVLKAELERREHELAVPQDRGLDERPGDPLQPGGRLEEPGGRLEEPVR